MGARKEMSGELGLKKLLMRAGLIILGTAVYALGVKLFYVPSKLMSGGITGISLILNRLLGLPIGTMIIAMNIPLFILGYKRMGREFFILSLAGVLGTSVLIDLFAVIIPDIPELANDRLLSSAIGGVLTGAGLGITIALGGSTGGTDIMALLFSKKTESLSLGRVIMIADIIIIAAGILLFRDIESGLYTAVAMYVSTVVIDSVMYGANIASVVFIVTQTPEPIARALMYELKRGLTVLNGRGGYTGGPQNILMCAVSRRQLSHLKRIVRTNDPNAFVMVSDAKEIMGRGFKRYGV